MMLSRRHFALGAAAALLTPELSWSAAVRRMPTVFFAHGAPTLAGDKPRGAQLKALGAQLPARPSGIVAFTPHVRAERMTLAGRGVALRSFPRRFLEGLGDLEYAPPAADALAMDVRRLLGQGRDEVSPDAHEGFNHTVWMGLIHMFPAADIPVVEVAIPFHDAVRLFELGRCLAPLRANGVLIVSSGSLTHNLATIGVADTPSWAREFDEWTGKTLAAGDIDQLLDWRQRAPAAGYAHPDDGGHFNVLMYALGAVADAGLLHAQAFHEGFELGSFSTRDYIFT